MGFDNLNHYERMDVPEERQAEDLKRQDAKKPGWKKKSTSKSVSLTTFAKSTTFVSFVIWSLFLLVVGYGTYLLIGIFTSN